MACLLKNEPTVGAGEIPLPLSFFYLFNEAELDFTVQFLALMSLAGRSGLKVICLLNCDNERDLNLLNSPNCLGSPLAS